MIKNDACSINVGTMPEGVDEKISIYGSNIRKRSRVLALDVMGTVWNFIAMGITLFYLIYVSYGKRFMSEANRDDASFLSIVLLVVLFILAFITYWLMKNAMEISNDIKNERELLKIYMQYKISSEIQ